MASSIFDIAPASETVSINGNDVKVVGVPLRIVVQIAKDAPELLALLMGGGLDAAAFISKAPEMVELVIAAGFGEPDNAEVRKHAGALPLDTQVDLLTAILKATMGGGAGPFIVKLAKARAMLTVEEEKEPEGVRVKLKQETSSQKPSISSVPTEDFPEAKYGT